MDCAIDKVDTVVSHWASGKDCFSLAERRLFIGKGFGVGLKE